MPKNASGLIALTTDGVTKYYVQLDNGLITPWTPRQKKDPESNLED